MGVVNGAADVQVVLGHKGGAPGGGSAPASVSSRSILRKEDRPVRFPAGIYRYSVS